jgi:hypothetical protein
LVGWHFFGKHQRISNSKVGMMMEQGEAKESQTVAETYVGTIPIKDVKEFFRIIPGIPDADFSVSSLHLHPNKRESCPSHNLTSPKVPQPFIVLDNLNFNVSLIFIVYFPLFL